MTSGDVLIFINSLAIFNFAIRVSQSSCNIDPESL